VYNNGLGIPVEVHKEEGVYVPELIFGHLLTSSNYNDKDAKVRGQGAQPTGGGCSEAGSGL
jgi:DNA topoisomerase-2